MQEENYFDDEIDLREIVLTLFKGWKVILLTTVLVAVTAFAISKWVLPKKISGAGLSGDY